MTPEQVALVALVVMAFFVGGVVGTAVVTFFVTIGRKRRRQSQKQEHDMLRLIFISPNGSVEHFSTGSLVSLLMFVGFAIQKLLKASQKRKLLLILSAEEDA